MKVRRYFVGFGPTLWSTMRPNRLGYTEYGVKAVPLGGFCDIAGMTSVDELAPEDRPYAMYRQKVWKRVAVLFAGPAMNFVIGLVLIYGIAVVWGLPNLHPPTTAIVGETACVAADVSKGEPGKCTGPGPAANAGIKPGDTVVKVGGTDVKTFDELVAAVRKARRTDAVRRAAQRGRSGPRVHHHRRRRTHPALGEEGRHQPDHHRRHRGRAPPSSGRPSTTRSRRCPRRSRSPATSAVEIGKSLAKIPTKVGALVHSIGGGERDPETPISVVGASIIGGDTVEHGLWVAFWFFLAQLNFVLGAVNLVPLLPFDGGHIAIAVYEKIRNMIRSVRRIDAAGPVNYLKLMPATYVVLVVVVGYMLLTVTADLVNPIRLFQ